MTKQKKEHMNLSGLYRDDMLFCQYHITDFKKSIAFYSEGLELEPSEFSKNEPIPEHEGVYEFNLPVKGAILSLHKRKADTITLYNNLVISVTDIDQYKHQLDLKNIKSTEIMDIPGLLSTFTLKDPDGNSIIILSDPRVN